MVSTFPLNVQAGSPQYTTVNQITPNTNSSLWVHNPDYIRPVNNAYYTIQNADGSKWCTFYVSNWGQDPAGDYETLPEWSSSNTTDAFPKGSLCWCIWCKEYYDSLITPISTINNEISTINNNISTINNNISTINNEIDTITPKVDDSFVSATKTNDTTLRLTRNDGTTVDISFPESGVKYRREIITASPATYVSNSNELVRCDGSRRRAEFSNKTLEVSGYSYYGYIQVRYTSNNGPTTKIATRFTDPITLSDSISDFDVSGLLYNGAILTVKE